MLLTYRRDLVPSKRNDRTYFHVRQVSDRFRAKISRPGYAALFAMRARTKRKKDHRRAALVQYDHNLDGAGGKHGNILGGRIITIQQTSSRYHYVTLYIARDKEISRLSAVANTYPSYILFTYHVPSIDGAPFLYAGYMIDETSPLSVTHVPHWMTEITPQQRPQGGQTTAVALMHSLCPVAIGGSGAKRPAVMQRCTHRAVRKHSSCVNSKTTATHV